jgi:hypothetical protein
VLVADGLSVRTDIREAFTVTLTDDSRTLACYVSQMSGLGRRHRITCYCSRHSIGGIQGARNCYKGAAKLMRNCESRLASYREWNNSEPNGAGLGDPPALRGSVAVL